MQYKGMSPLLVQDSDKTIIKRASGFVIEAHNKPIRDDGTCNISGPTQL